MKQPNEKTLLLLFAHQQKSWADKLPAQPPVKTWLEAHHPLNIFTEAVHTWSKHERLRSKG